MSTSLEYQFKKGVSGNPKGRPPGSKSRKVVARRVAERSIMVNGEQTTFLKALLMVLRNKAAEGNLAAFRYMEKLRHRIGLEDGIEDEVLPPIFRVHFPCEGEARKRYHDRIARAERRLEEQLETNRETLGVRPRKPAAD